MSEQANQADAIVLCVLLEKVAPEFGYHVALTGGQLYREDSRKDIDVVLYRIRGQRGDRVNLLKAIKGVDVIAKQHFGWLTKANWRGIAVDLMFPDYKSPLFWHDPFRAKKVGPYG